MQASSAAVPAVRDTGEALRASLVGILNSLTAVVPKLLGFLAVLIVGWILSSLVAKGVAALLHALRFNELARRSGIAEFVRRMAVRTDSTGVIASVAKWFIRLITLVAAFDLLGLPAVSGVLQQLLLWLPNLAVALVVLVIGGLAANALSRIVRGATTGAGFVNPDLLATATRVAVWSFAIVVAVDQLGVATTLVNALLYGLVGALALATGLAFGLAGRDRAALLLNEWARRTEDLGRKPEEPGAETIADLHSAPERVTDDLEEEELPEHRSGFDRRRVNRPGSDRRIERNGTTG
jgi:mechanosensitive ion channel-like protein